MYAMKLPSLPSNPVTDAVEQAADEVVEAAEQVLESMIGTVGEVDSGDNQPGLRVLQKGLSLAEAAKGQARDRVETVVNDSVASTIESATGVVMVVVALVVVAVGMAMAGANAAVSATARVAFAMGRLTLALGAFEAQRAAAELRSARQRLRKEANSVGGASADLQTEIRRLRSEINGEINKGNDRWRGERESILNNFEQAARLLADLAGSTTGAASATSGAPPPSTPSSGKVRRMEKIDQMANRLEGYARRRVGLPPVVRAHVIEACTPMPRLARPNFAPSAALPVGPRDWTKKV